MVTEEQLTRMEALTARMEAAAARVEAVKGKGGKGGAQRGAAWHEKKRQRAERYHAGLQPLRVVQTPMCFSCGRNQPSQYCDNRACHICCEAGHGGHCSYHWFG